MQKTTNQGTQLTPVAGLKEFFMVEFDDGSAELFNTWDEAMMAGSFDTEAK